MDISKLTNENCIFQKENPVAFLIVCGVTNNDPCNGCYGFNNGMCPGYRLLMHNEPAKKVGKIPKYTNKEIAEKLQTTKRQVSKMRKEKTLPQEYM